MVDATSTLSSCIGIGLLFDGGNVFVVMAEILEQQRIALMELDFLCICTSVLESHVAPDLFNRRGAPESLMKFI